MAVYKDNNGKWYVQTYRIDNDGKRKHTVKRGFKTKREASDWEKSFTLYQKKSVNMFFSDFVKVYENDLAHKLRLNTWQTKKTIIEKKIIPFFGDKRVSEITSQDIINWHNYMLSPERNDGKGYSQDYLKTVHNQLSAILNHAVKFYGLEKNVATLVGNMGKKNTKEMSFWTQEEYKAFSEAIMDKPISFYIFEVFYWCGLRLGELLALTREDVNLFRKTIRINKSLQRIGGQDIITDPKTPKSKRTVVIPDFLAEELKEYFDSCQCLEPKDRIFPVKKNYIEREMERGCKAAEVNKIRIHDLRHSHVSLLIDMGFSAIAIAERVGHESIDITYRYAHLFPTIQTQMATKLDLERIS